MNFEETKKAIKAKRDIRKKKDVLFEGIPCEIRQVSALGMEMYREYANSEDPAVKHLARASLIQMCLYHKESGKRIFEESELREIMTGHTGPEIDNLYWQCMAINGYGANSGQEILKNLLTTLGEDGLLELQEIIDAQLQSFSKDTPPGSSVNNGSSNNTGPSEARQTP